MSFEQDGTMKLHVSQPPVDGSANDAVVAALKEFFGLKSSQVEIVRGATSRQKQIRLTDVDPYAIARRIEEARNG